MYIVERVELIELTYNEDTNNFNIKAVDDFLKSKSQVQEIANGEVINLNGKHIKIFIQVQEVE